MSREIERRHFTGTEFERLVEVGIIAEDDRFELLNGDIIKLHPVTPRHASYVLRLNSLLSRHCATHSIVSVHNPVRLNDFSDPQPDVALLAPRGDFYASASEKVSDETGWQHTRITLEPLNPDFDPIILEPEDEGDVSVVAEFVGALSSES